MLALYELEYIGQGHLTAPERPSKNGLMVILAEGKYDELFSRRASERVNTLALDPG